MRHSDSVSPDGGRDSYHEVSETAELAAYPLLAALHAYWRDLAGDRAMPQVSEVDALTLPRQALPFIFLIDVVEADAGPRFRIRLMGTQAIEQAGVDQTGRYIDETPGAEGVQQRFSSVICRRRPYFAELRLTWSSRSYKRYRTLVCPLADDADPDRVARLLAIALFS